LHPKQIQRWRDQFLNEAENVFVHKTSKKKEDPDKAKLLLVINQLSMELDYLKKKLGRNE
jgi:transposase